MAYISRECVSCTDATKRCEGRYSGKDEKGKGFSGRMYYCDNMNCKVNMSRRRGEKQLDYETEWKPKKVYGGAGCGTMKKRSRH